MNGTYTPTPDADANGTSFHGTVLNELYAGLVGRLGMPHCSYGPDDKVQYEWVFTGPDGSVVTLYDWKQYGISRPSQWHVGGRSKKSTEAFRRWFEGGGCA